MEGYGTVRRLAEGRFGTVFLAKNLHTGADVAVKKIRARRPLPGGLGDPWSKSASREIEVLQQVQHENVVRLLCNTPATQSGTTILVYEFVRWDLQLILEKHRRQSKDGLPAGVSKVGIKMLLAAVSHLHSVGVMHRDLKPSNILVEHGTGIFKVADFGSARFVSTRAGDDSAVVPGSGDNDPLTQDVCTRWYKSPEMLFGSVDYTVAVDLWSSGCIFGELVSLDLEALFCGRSDIEQLCYIFRVTGTPDQTDWEDVRCLPDYGKVEFNACQPSDLPCEARMSRDAREFLRGLLHLNPARRLPAATALEHPYIREMPEPSDPSEFVSGIDDYDDRDQLESTSLAQEACVPLDYDSDDSDFDCAGLDADPILLETTTCGLWADDDSDGLPPVGAGEHTNILVLDGGGTSTPPPPPQGFHQFKQDRR